LKTCSVEGCKTCVHARNLCRQHYDAERLYEKAAAAADIEGKPPQSRGGRRGEYTPDRMRFLNTNGFRPGLSGNPYGASGVALEIYRRSNEETLEDSLPWLERIINDPETANRDRILAIATRDKIRMNTAMLIFGPSGMPSVDLLAADGGVVTPLTKLAADNKGADYEAHVLAEARRIEQDRAAEHAAKENQLAAARAARANGEEIHPATALLLKVKDEKE
jgi:hypothetical protein